MSQQAPPPRPQPPPDKQQQQQQQQQEDTTGNTNNTSGVDGISLLQKRAVDVRRNRVNWRSYLQSQMISEEQYQIITQIDSTATNPEERSKLLLSERGPEFIRVIYDLMHHISKEQASQYLLTMLDDWLQEDKSRAQLFYDYGRRQRQSVFRMFIHFINRPDAFTVNQASRIIAKLACWGRQWNVMMEGTELQFYLIWLRDQLRLPQNEYIQTTARCLQMMLRVDEYRVVFAHNEGIATIVNVLTGSGGGATGTGSGAGTGGVVNFQIQYQLIFCLWCMSYSNDLCRTFVHYNVVPTLTDILNNSSKEKVMRIILATLRNLLEKTSADLNDKQVLQEYAVAIVHGKVLKTLGLIRDRKYDDPDITEDVEFLDEKLQSCVQALSSIEEYVAELKSGRLEWSPVHNSERFWRENAEKFNDHNYELLKILIHLMDTSKDALVLSVAVHDVGEYVRHYPRGKQVIEKLNGKHLVMVLLQHPDANVRYQALLAVQKIMVHNWEYLGRQLEKEAGESAGGGGAPKSTVAVK